jgi:hypothetical protein
MIARRLRIALALLTLFAGLGSAVPAGAETEAERLRTAKTLFFDRKYAEARQAWETVRASAKGTDGDAAAYWIARCSESLGENERAMKEYDAFLALHSRDSALVEEARTSRVGLAAKLYRAGNKRYVTVLREAVNDASKTVRYYAALQMSGLDADMGHLSAPVLRQILAQEKDPDLVDRAKLGLLRWDQAGLGAVSAAARVVSPAPRAPGKEARWVHIRVTEKGGSHPKVAINLPLALAEMVFKSLPDDVKTDLRHEGYDAETFWDRLRRMGASEIISVEGEDGQRVQIWTED